MSNNILSKTKEKIQKINKKVNLKNIAVIALIVACFFAFNLGGMLTKVLTSITSIFSNETEIKTVEITSDGYEEKEDGSFKITKHADWTSTSTAQITWVMESFIEKDSVKKDIILVLDTSASMNEGRRIDKVKANLKELITEVLVEEDNKLALITFNDDATILSELSDDKKNLLKMVDDLKPSGDTNYNQALIKVGEILSTYKETSGREVEVLFITDGYPNIDTPNQEATYEELKLKYPFITIHGIQYEMGKDVVVEIKKISDKQYATDSDYLINYLIEAAFSPEPYEVFEIVDYINNDYFIVESESNISTSVGDVSLTTENGKQKIIWTAPNKILTGNEYKLKINLKLKDEYVEKKGLYSTNIREIINIKLPGGELVNFDTTKVPKLMAPYKVTYEANAPEGCSASINLEEENYAFTTVNFSNETLECDGYQFKGWKTVEETTKVNDNSFIMPTENIVVRGVWTKIELNKSMQGNVYEKLSLYKAIANQAVPDNIKSQYVTSVTGINFKNSSSNTNGKGIYTVSSTINNKYPIHYFRGDVDNNNVLFGGYCWKIVRTTETGGVKMIYNGNPVDGKCTNTTGIETQIGTSMYNSSDHSLSSAGYMFNRVYDGKEFYIYKWSYLDGELTTIENTNYYYGTGIEYENGKYRLINPEQKTWESNYNELKGYYTCLSNNEVSCYSVYYIKHASSGSLYYIRLNNGMTIDEAIITLSSSVTKNADGTYTLDNPIKVKKIDWITDYKKYKNYYSCSNMTDTTCSTINYLYNTGSLSYSYNSSNQNYLYGSSFLYDSSTGTYKLENTKSIWKFGESYNILNNYHYTCKTANDTCTKLSFIFNADNRGFIYIDLTNGQSIDEALNDMIWENDVNSKDSLIKSFVDSWYRQNMTKYTQYLEDAKWCNDRSSSMIGGWSVSGSVSEKFYFEAYNRLKFKFTPVLDCKENDSFTIDTSSGNGKLTYPVGLITTDELMYAGGRYNNYLDNGQDYWTMSPGYKYWSLNLAYNGVEINSYKGLNLPTKKLGVRPMISLKPDIGYSKGNGLPESPYVIDLSAM